MKQMHPTRKKELKKHEPTVPQVKITTKEAKRYLYRLSTRDQSCPGVFAWCGTLLLPMRGRKKTGNSSTFLNQMARLVARIASAEVPDIFGFILTCGGIFALNKLNPEEQRARKKKRSRSQTATC